MSLVRLGSVILLILGLLVIVVPVIYVPSPPLTNQLVMFGTGLTMVAFALLTIRIRDLGGELQD